MIEPISYIESEEGKRTKLNKLIETVNDLNKRLTKLETAFEDLLNNESRKDSSED